MANVGYSFLFLHEISIQKLNSPFSSPPFASLVCCSIARLFFLYLSSSSWPTDAGKNAREGERGREWRGEWVSRRLRVTNPFRRLPPPIYLRWGSFESLSCSRAMVVPHTAPSLSLSSFFNLQQPLFYPLARFSLGSGKYSFVQNAENNVTERNSLLMCYWTENSAIKTYFSIKQMISFCAFFPNSSSTSNSIDLTENPL